MYEKITFIALILCMNYSCSSEQETFIDSTEIVSNEVQKREFMILRLVR